MIRKNERLDEALKAAKKSTAAKKRTGSHLLTPSRASKLSRQYWESQKTIPTATTRIHKDALELGKAAWKDSADRIMEESAAIRERARKALGI